MSALFKEALSAPLGPKDVRANPTVIKTFFSSPCSYLARFPTTSQGQSESDAHLLQL